MSIIDEFLQNKIRIQLLDYDSRLGYNGAYTVPNYATTMGGMTPYVIYYRHRIAIDDICIGDFMYVIKDKFGIVFFYDFGNKNNVVSLDHQIKSRLNDNKISIKELSTLIEFHKL